MKQESLERALVDGCKRGDRTAQRELYSRYAAAMYNVCLRMVRNQADAEDMLQNAFIDVFTKIDTYRGEATIGAWIKRIMINTCINFLKRRRLDVQEWDDRISEDAADDGGVVIEEENLTVKRIKSAMNELPDGYRTVFSLYALEGYDHKEIAEILDITEATSKSQYSRAKSKMRLLLEDM